MQNNQLCMYIQYILIVLYVSVYVMRRTFLSIAVRFNTEPSQDGLHSWCTWHQIINVYAYSVQSWIILFSIDLVIVSNSTSLCITSRAFLLYISRKLSIRTVFNSSACYKIYLNEVKVWYREWIQQIYNRITVVYILWIFPLRKKSSTDGTRSYHTDQEIPII